MSTEEKTSQVVQLNEDNLDTIQTYVRWLKVCGIIDYILAGIFVLVTFLYAITIVGLIVAPIFGLFVWLYIWLGNKLKEASKNSKKLLGEQPTTEEDFKDISIKNMKSVGAYFKVTGIISIIGLSFYAILIVIFIIFFAVSLSQGFPPSYNDATFQSQSVPRFDR